MEMNLRSPLIIGHRGAAGEAPENTLASFRLAVEQGCDGVELDVHLTKDGKLAVIHDGTLDRTTTGTGAVADLTAEEIRQADAGSKFHTCFAGEKVPLLEEVFDLLPAEMLINVEIKSGHPALPATLVALLKEKNRQETVVISSFDHKILRTVKDLDPGLRIGLLYAANVVDHCALALSTGTDVYSLHPEQMLIGRADIAQAVASSLQVYPWTADGEGEMLRLIKAGASGIITNFPGRLRSVIAKARQEVEAVDVEAAN
jgi:glycerophosphoryl diester phosphodiesterase